MKEFENFTHRATLYGVPIYFNLETNAVKGVNKLMGLYLDVLIWLELRWPASDCDMFPIVLIRELTDQEKNKINK